MMNKKNILFIGANNMHEIGSYVKDYQNGLFIEAIPTIFKQLSHNLETTNNKCNTNYKALNYLVTDIIGKEYTFNIFNNNGASSSIYEANPSIWKWSGIDKVDEIKLVSTTINNILKEQSWGNIKYDLVLDVQGAELDVLKGFSIDNLNNIQEIIVEISTKQFYKNGVLFNDLHNFICKNGFKLCNNPRSDHCDVKYVRL